MSFLPRCRMSTGAKATNWQCQLATYGYRPRVNDSQNRIRTRTTSQLRRNYATATQPAPTPRSNDTVDTEDSSVLYARLDDPPLKVVGSKGSYLFTSNGKKILDSTGGAAVACIGHNDTRVKEAIARQLNDVAYCWAPLFTSEPAERLAKYLCDSTGGKMSRVYIVSSGTESIEACMKLARQYFLELPQKQPQRTHFIARDRSYHGNTLGALALGGHAARKKPYDPILATNVSHVSPCYPYRDQRAKESDAEYVARLAQELEDEFQRVGPETVCAFVAETMSGTTLGTVPPTAGYMKAMKEVCDRHGALFVLDEVMSGMGRTGTLHAWEQEGVVPDLQTVAKGLGGGYAPIGALLINKKIVETIKGGSSSFMHSQTYQGHALACAAACEVQQIVKDENLLANVRNLGEYFGKSMKENLGPHANVGDIRGRGFFWGIEFVKDKSTKKPFPPEMKVGPLISKLGLLHHDISLIPVTGLADGKSGDGVQIAPPYNSTKEEIDEIVKRLGSVIKEALG